jgi:hypothetical protein
MKPLELIDFLDTEALTEEQIELSPAQMEQAAKLSQTVADPSQQWQLYIHALGLLGFKQWLEEWAPDLEIADSQHPKKQFPNVESCNLTVAGFGICLIATVDFSESTVKFPQTVINLPANSLVDSSQSVPHIYALVEVQEERMQAKVCGYLRRERLIQQLRELKLTARETLQETSQDYAVPLSWFNLEPTELILELRCLAPDLLPAEVTPAEVTPAKVSPAKVSLAKVSPPSPLINVSHWLNDRLDEVAQQLGWILLPSLVPAAALRSAQEELLLLGVQIPSEARGVYQELQSGQAMLRLHAMTWVISSASDAFVWTLLIILDGERLPIGTSLQIRDQDQLLFEQVATATDSSLFAQVGGDLSDQFWVTITLPDGATIDLPPFYFGDR